MMPRLPHFLFTHTRSPQPDGRALYAYKATDDAYRYLRDDVRDGLIARRYGGEFPAIFCLYAAETFRREHAGGPWTWETIFQPLGREAPTHARIHWWVEQGLAWWGRSLLIAPGRHRLFLVTLACEGGLPLRLLIQQDAHLTRFFHALLERYVRGGNGGAQAAKQLAREQVQRLPPSLRQEPVLHLTGELIAGVCALQPTVAGLPDPLAVLDEQIPDWRRGLPLRLDDQVAERLLLGLWQHTGELAEESRARPRWRGELRLVGGDWRVYRRLELPDAATIGQLQAWTGIAPQGPRLRLLLDTEHGMEPVAWLTRIESTGQETRYRREWLRTGGLVRPGTEAMSVQRLVLLDGRRETPLEALDADPWGPLPWMFHERGGGGHWQWLSEGSGRTRAARAMVLAPVELTPADADHAPQGRVADLDRLVYAVADAMELRGLEGERYCFTCGADVDSSGSFALSGLKLPLPGRSRPVYQGLPTFVLIDDLGGRSEARGRLQWRPVGDGGPWRSRADGGRGLLWLRLLDEQGRERCRRQTDVVPRSLSIEANIGSGSVPGVVRLTGLVGASVRADVGVSPDRAATTMSDPDSVEITCPVVPNIASYPLALELTWPDTAPLILRLPYPQRGAFFDLGGRPLPDDDGIALDRVGALRLIVQDAAGGASYWLRIELLADACLPVFQERLPPLQQGHMDASLYRWQDRIASLLAGGSGLEDEVRLSIETGFGQRLARVRVSRFDAVIEPDREQGLLRIPSQTQARLGTGWSERVRLAMFPLWQPEAEHLPLLPSDDDPTARSVPTGLEPGPWWVVGRDGDWARFRPLLWVVAGGTEFSAAVASPLAEAIREPHPLRRETAIARVIAELGASPDDPDWLLLTSFIELAQVFPPTSLDALCALTAQPRTLACALLRADEQAFEAIWSLSARMPFLWMLIPVSDWRMAADRYFQWLRASLAEIESADDLVFGLFQAFRDRCIARRPYWNPLCDWLQEQVFPERPVPGNSELRLARLDMGLLEQVIATEESELMGRHDPDERWPTGEAVGELMAGIDNWMRGYRYAHLAEFYRPIRQAPFVAAQISIHGIEPHPRLVYELRLLRAFDRDWFDRVHAIALTIALAQTAPDANRPGP